MSSSSSASSTPNVCKCWGQGRPKLSPETRTWKAEAQGDGLLSAGICIGESPDSELDV